MAWQFCDCDLLGMVKKWPEINGWLSDLQRLGIKRSRLEITWSLIVCNWICPPGTGFLTHHQDDTGDIFRTRKSQSKPSQKPRLHPEIQLCEKKNSKVIFSWIFLLLMKQALKPQTVCFSWRKLLLTSPETNITCFRPWKWMGKEADPSEIGRPTPPKI